MKRFIIEELPKLEKFLVTGKPESQPCFDLRVLKKNYTWAKVLYLNKFEGTLGSAL
jgi:hypothetical protein